MLMQSKQLPDDVALKAIELIDEAQQDDSRRIDCTKLDEKLEKAKVNGDPTECLREIRILAYHGRTLIIPKALFGSCLDRKRRARALYARLLDVVGSR